VFLCGKPVQGVLNILLTLLFWVPGIIHALFVVSSHKADQRMERLIKVMERRGKGT